MEIQIITSNKLFPNSVSLLAPFIVWKKQLQNLNINSRIIYDITKLQDSDYIILDSKFHRSFWSQSINKIFHDIKLIKKKCNKFIYFDTTDSTSSLQVEVLDFVDKYWKMQILKNKENYLKKYYGGRIFTDHLKALNIVDKNNSSLNNKLHDSTKLHLIEEAWNASFLNYSLLRKLINDIFINFKILRFFSFKSQFTDPTKYRNKELSARFSTNYSRETIKWQRNLVKNKLINLCDTSNINRFKYYKELATSKYAIAPFGWGEITYRDFEIFTSGAILIKPNMDHILTWPNFYKENETYLSFDWNCDNLLNVLDDSLINYKKFIEIAINAQTFYKKNILGSVASINFAERLNSLLARV